MSKIMDRVIDLQAVDWTSTPRATLTEWEEEALNHDCACRCHKCALFFARMAPSTYQASMGCAIGDEIIMKLRGLLTSMDKL